MSSVLLPVKGQAGIDANDAMVKLNKIYTRTGDKGDTGLVGGERRPKYDLRVEAYGDVDEANSVIGLARRYTKGEDDNMLSRIQHDLFDLGADLATPYPPFNTPRKRGGQWGGEALRIIDSQVKRLEKEIDQLNANLKPLNSFVLPGGSDAAAFLHLARTVVRRAERVVCALATVEKVNPVSIKYLNRLSDFLFVLARVANHNGADDVLWQPGVNR
jgi:cob(I)alamin adenosyltransferase